MKMDKMKNIVYNCDCMEYMKDIPDNAFDLAIVDPPYGIGQFLHGNKNYKPKKINWNNNIPDKNYFDELKRISVNWIIWGWNYYTEHLGSTKRLLVWDKCTSYKSNFSEIEIAAFSFDSPGRIVKLDRFNNILKERHIHPCQKPVALGKWQLARYAKPGDKILDTHVGSGYMRIACHDMGFDFRGCEKNPGYWQAQENRFKDHLAKGKEIFEVDEYQQLIFKD